jgi:hypothetical protein
MRVIVLLIFCSLVGCASDLDRYSANGGLLNAHFLTDTYSSVQQRANNFCENRGMAAGAINKVSTGCLAACGSEYSKYEFSCTKTSEHNRATSRSGDPEKNFQQAKAECESIGFKPSTENFANCVLKLIENNSSAANVNKLESDIENLHKTLKAEESQRLRQDAIDRLNKSYQSEESRRKQASDDLMNDRSFRDRNQREMCRSRGNQYCD